MRKYSIQTIRSYIRYNRIEGETDVTHCIFFRKEELIKSGG